MKTKLSISTCFWKRKMSLALKSNVVYRLWRQYQSSPHKCSNWCGSSYTSKARNDPCHLLTLKNTLAQCQPTFPAWMGKDKGSQEAFPGYNSTELLITVLQGGVIRRLYHTDIMEFRPYCRENSREGSVSHCQSLLLTHYQWKGTRVL